MGLPYLLFALIALLFHTSAVPPDKKCEDRGGGYCHPPSEDDCDDDNTLPLPCSQANETCCRLPPQIKCEELGGTCMDPPDDNCPFGRITSAKCDKDDMKCCKKE